MAKISFNKLNSLVDTITSSKNKTATIKLGTRGQLKSTLKKFGVDLPKGASSYTFRGDTTELRRTFNRVAYRVPVGIGSDRTRFVGVLVGNNLKSVTFTVGKTDTVSSAGKVLKSKIIKGKKVTTETISTGDPKQFLNFGLRQNGKPRTGYTLGQCYFSYAFRRSGSVGKYRYGGYNPIIKQTRLQIQKQIARTGGTRSK